MLKGGRGAICDGLCSCCCACFGSCFVVLGVLLWLDNVNLGPGLFRIRGEKQFTISASYGHTRYPKKSPCHLRLYADADRSAFNAELRVSTLIGIEAIFVPADSHERAKYLDIPLMGYLRGVEWQDPDPYYGSRKITCLFGTYALRSNFQMWPFWEAVPGGEGETVVSDPAFWDFLWAVGGSLLALGWCCCCAALWKLRRLLSREPTPAAPQPAVLGIRHP